MRSISEEILTQLRSGYITSFKLFEFTDGTDWYRYTDKDVPVYWAEDSTSLNKYTPYAVEIENIDYSYNNVVDSISIKISNLNSIMIALFANRIIQENVFNVYFGVMNSNNNIIDVFKIFEGEIDEYEIDEGDLNVKVASYFSKWADKSESKHGVLCRWHRFKGTECGYSGEGTTCNRLYKTCSEYGNIDNYGGFITVAAAENKDVFWGPIPDERRKEGNKQKKKY